MVERAARAGASVRPLPDSETEFLRALRASALAGVDLRADHEPLGMTQLELEQQTSMSRPSIINLVRHFRPALVDRRAEGARSGRIALDADAGIVIGVHVGHAELRVAASDLYGRIHATSAPERYEQRAGGAIEDADTTLDWMAGAIERLVNELGRSPEQVVGIGIGLAGPVDRERGVLRTALFRAAPEGESDWELVGVRDDLRRRLGWETVPLLIDNDANLSALAEYTWGAARSRQERDYRNLIYLEWSHGLGAGLVIGGELYRGAGVAGEIGHAVISTDGPTCQHCGNNGCLEAFAAWPALSREIPSAADLVLALRLARTGDATARAAFADAADHVARAIGPLISVLNPDLVLIGGTVGQEGYDLVRPSLMRALKRYTMRPALQDVEIAAATLPAPTAIQGTFALVLRAPKDDPDPLLAYLKGKAHRARDAA